MVGMHSTTDPRSIQSLDSNVMSATSSSFLQMQELSAAIYLYQSYLSSNLAFYPEPFALQSPGRPLPRTCVETHTLHQSVTGKISSTEEASIVKVYHFSDRMLYYYYYQLKSSANSPSLLLILRFRSLLTVAGLSRLQIITTQSNIHRFEIWNVLLPCVFGSLADSLDNRPRGTNSKRNAFENGG